MDVSQQALREQRALFVKWPWETHTSILGASDRILGEEGLHDEDLRVQVSVS